VIEERARQSERLFGQMITDLKGKVIAIQWAIVTPSDPSDLPHPLPPTGIGLGLLVIPDIGQMIRDRYHFTDFRELQKQIPVHGIV
jgi:hypothetical protein